MNAPNDVWSLGVILVNLTCRRNPWRQASHQDATYQRFMLDPTSFLQTILPVSDELNDILGKIFTPDPARRITLPELKQRILECRRFTTMSPQPDQYDSDSCDATVSDEEFDDSDRDSDDSMSRCTTMDGLEPEDRPDVLQKNLWPSPPPTPPVDTQNDAIMDFGRLSCSELPADCPSPASSVASDSTLVDEVYSSQIHLTKGFEAVKVMTPPATPPPASTFDGHTPHLLMPFYPHGQVHYHPVVPHQLQMPISLPPSPVQTPAPYSRQPLACAAHVSDWWRHIQPNFNYHLPLYNMA